MRDDLAQIAGTGGILYGLSKTGKLYTLDIGEDGSAEWILIAEPPKLKYLPPKSKPKDAEDH